MKQKNDTLIVEVNDLKKEVKMLRAIVQSLMYVIAEDQGLDLDIEEEMADRNPVGSYPTRNYVS